MVCAPSSCCTTAPQRCARLEAIGKGDLQHFGQMMDGAGGAEPHRGDIVALENVQHLHDVHAGGRGRRRAEDFPAAIISPDRRALDGLVRCEILARDEAAMRFHVIQQDVAERTAIERRLAVARDGGERLGIFGLHHAIACVQRRSMRKINRGDRLVSQHLGRGIDDAFVQIGRRQKAARGVPDRRLHDIGQTHGPEPLLRLAPGLERAGHGDRLRTGEIFIVDRIEHIMRRARL